MYLFTSLAGHCCGDLLKSYQDIRVTNIDQQGLPTDMKNMIE